MRRVLTILTAIALSLASLAVGVFTADLPFWRRAMQLPLQPDEIYLPVATIGAQPRDDPPRAAAAIPAADVIELAATRARDAGSRALLVMRGGELVLSRYFAADDEHTLLPAGLVARPVVAMAIGVALGEGAISSLDAPIGAYLPEWDDEPRGRITLRQLLEETSGLETGGDIERLLHRSPWRDLADLPRFATSRGVRMLLGNDFAGTALGFRLRHEPGGFYNVSPANAQLAALILERATRTPYEQYVDEHLWRAAGGGRAELAMDRRAGMPAAHCCWRATAPDVLRVLSLLANDGMAGDRRVLPKGWVEEMARASNVHADSGLQVLRANAGGWFSLSGTADGSAFWVVPSRELAILNLVATEGSTPPELPALLMRVFCPN
ncbi:MAG TPA: serine hydrolase [Steroidobacteraceae bacterium]|nr:serine hydrolase [Steroidobacteraceae bacterium]